jgi:Flp pilus assembly pilin Flp
MINTMFHTFWKEEEGQDMVEYALLLAFVALAAVTVLSSVKTQISQLWSSVNSSLSKAGS